MDTFRELRGVNSKDDVFSHAYHQNYPIKSIGMGKSFQDIHDDSYAQQEECQTCWEDSPENAQNFPSRKKWRIVGIASWLSFVTPLASSMMNPALPDLARNLDVRSSVLTIMVVSLYLLGFGFSGLIAAPFSEMYGRRPLYNLSNLCFAGLTLACGFAPNIGGLLALRLLAGSLGTACLNLGGATCADVFSPQQRAQGIALWASGTLFASCLGPVFGGIIVQSKGWRWILYILAMTAAVNVVLCALFMPETAAVVLKHRKGAASGAESESAKPDRSIKATLHSLVRPLKLLTFSPVVLIMAIYSAVCHAVIYLLFTSIPFTLSPRYQLSARRTGLVYLAPGFGMVLGAFIGGYLSGRTVSRARARGDVYTPEKRLDPSLTLSGTASMIAGLLLYGWSVAFHIHVAAALIGLLLYGFGLVSTATYAQTYVVESHIEHAASVGAAFTVLTAILSGILPITGIDLFSSLGIGWGAVLLAGIVLISCSAFAVCRLKGEYLRTRFKVKL